jgi:hypothetical protein
MYHPQQGSCQHCIDIGTYEYMEVHTFIHTYIHIHEYLYIYF